MEKQYQMYVSDFLRLNPKTEYVSHFAFINTKNTISKKDISFVEYTFKNDKKTGLFLTDNYIISQYQNNKFNKIPYDNRINNITPVQWYFSYIKILNDNQHPELEGKILILRFGLSLRNIILDLFNGHNNKKIDKVFCFKSIKHDFGYQSYEGSHFIDLEFEMSDENLDVDNDIKFKKFDIIKMDRIEKIKKINTNENS